MELKKSISGIRLATIYAIVGIVLTGSNCNVSSQQSKGSDATRVIPEHPPESRENTSARMNVVLPDFADIAARQGPSVVNISISGTVKGGVSGLPKLDPDDPFFEFFKRFQIPAPQGEFPVHGMGSGFIISSDGILLTNAHVVADADEVTVKLTDKREFKARVIGADKPSDVAVLKIDARDLPTVHIGSAQNARVGEWVLAIGSPFGFENSVTAGIISAKSRSLPEEGYVPFLQTDVAINPGNSGGPLFNMNGEVIGINSQIYSRSGGYQGLSFAIPIEVAMKVEKQLLDHGKVSRGRLGVVIQEVNQSLADSFGLEKPVGALVSSVEKGGPADRAGIEPGDVILKFNGKQIIRSADLPPLVADVEPDSSATLEVWHKGKARTLSMKVGEMKVTSVREKPDRAGKGKLGLALRPLTPDERREMDLPDGGLLVEEVSDGPAARAGIHTGDVILSVNGEKVGSVEALKNMVQNHGKHLALQIMRGDQKIFVPINLGQDQKSWSWSWP
jgi:serine protease Do